MTPEAEMCGILGSINNPLVEKLRMSIEQHFVVGHDIYFQVDTFGIRRNRNTIRYKVFGHKELQCSD
jgi:hypothetical protein